MQGGNAQNKKRFIIVSLILILSLALPCFATVTESSGDGFALYNGVSMPVLPSISGFEYHAIVSYADYYALIVTNHPLVISNSADVVTSAETTVYAYSCSSPYDQFILDSRYPATVPSGTLVVRIGTSESPPNTAWGWSDYDILFPDNSVFLSGSDPVSLDGYTVIRVAGDISDLPEDVGGYYRIADPISAPSSAYASCMLSSGGVRFGDLVIADFEPFSWVVYTSTDYALIRCRTDEGVYGAPPGVYFYRSLTSSYNHLFAYRESETEGPTGAVTGLNIITPPLGETDYIVYAGSELQCTAQVTGTGDFNSAVTWSLSHSSSAEYYPTISETGLLSVLPGVPEQRIFITATSVADSSIYATVPVYIMPPAVSSVTITPSSATAAPGQNVQFSATVSGSNVEDSAVTWAVGGASSASTRITRDGLLLIGSDEVSPAIAVRATSDQDGSVYGTALVTINVPAAVTGVTITPDDIVLNRGDVQQFTATVSGTGSYDSSVSWQITSVYSAGTSISNTGLLTIGEEQKYDYIIIKATSTADPSLSATAYVFVEDAISDPMNIDLSVVERLLEEIKNYLKTLQHIFDRPHYFREFNMYTGKLNEQDEQITGLTFNFYRFMQNMEEYVGSIAYTFANGAEVQIREDTTEGFDWFSLFFGKDSGSKVEKSDFAGISTIVSNTRDLFDTGFGFSDFFELIGSVPFFTNEVGSQLDTTVSYFDVRDPDPFNMSVLGNRDEQLEEWRNKYTD